MTFRNLALLGVLTLTIGCSQPPASPSHAAKEHAGPPTVNTATVERDDPYWKRAMQEVYRSSEEIQAEDAREKRRGQALRKLIRGSEKQPLLALTFDDGPHPQYTEQLLDVLRRYKVKATFFVIGKMVEKHPELARKIAADGHLLANHTFSHVTLTRIPLDEMKTEYRANNDLIQKTVGAQMKFCRPPGGDYDKDVIDAAEACGLTTVLWTDDPADYALPGESVVFERTLAKLSNGGIILLHDGVEQTIDILPKIIENAESRGYRFVRVDEMNP